MAKSAPDLSNSELTLLLGVFSTRMRVAAQLWAHVTCGEDDACWLWSGHTIWGYGYLTLSIVGRRKTIRAHRLAFLLANGFLPPHPA